MNIREINEVNVYQATAPKTQEAESAKKTTTSLASENTDKFVKSDITYSPAYTKPTQRKDDNTDRVDMSKLTEESDKTISQFEKLIQALIAKQGDKATGKDIADLTLEDILGGKTDSTDGVEGTDAAKSDPFSVDNVAASIVDFAKAISGGDKSKIGLLRDAFKQGFGAAEGEYGGKGKLPDISYKTYDKVMSLFDAWEKEGTEAATADAAATDTATADKTAATK